MLAAFHLVLTAAWMGGAAPPVVVTGDSVRIDLQMIDTHDPPEFVLQEVALDGPWVGPPALLDESNAGDYQLMFADSRTNVPFFSQGFDAPPPISAVSRVRAVSLRGPRPRLDSMVVSIRRRRPDNVGFTDAWTESISLVSLPSPPPPPETTTLAANGSPGQQLDLLFLSEGYGSKGRAQFEADARRILALILAVEPFKTRRHKISARTLFLGGNGTGVTGERPGITVDTPLKARYGCKGVERNLCAPMDIVRNAARGVAYDLAVVITDSRRYGGSGFYNGYAVIPANSASVQYLAVHEFAHVLAGVADEYFSLAPPCPTNSTIVEPWEPNLTATLSTLKWRHLIRDGVPIPTPWPKLEYDEADRAFVQDYFGLRAEGAPEEAVDALISSRVPATRRILESARYHDAVGAFEGAGGRSCGLYRPEADCTMFTLIPDHFCRVCTEALAAAIDRYAP